MSTERFYLLCLNPLVHKKHDHPLTNMDPAKQGLEASAAFVGRTSTSPHVGHETGLPKAQFHTNKAMFWEPIPIRQTKKKHLNFYSQFVVLKLDIHKFIPYEYMILHMYMKQLHYSSCHCIPFHSTP